MADKIIAVVGATGAQGGGLVRAILNDPIVGLKREQSPEMLVLTKPRLWQIWVLRL